MAKAKKKGKSRGKKKGATKKRRRVAHRGGGINFGPYYAQLAKKGKKKGKSRGSKKKGGGNKGRKHRTAAQKRATAVLVARNKHRAMIAGLRSRGAAMTPEEKMMLRIGRRKAKHAKRSAASARPSTGHTGGGFSPELRARLLAMKEARAKAAAAATAPSSHYDVW